MGDFAPIRAIIGASFRPPREQVARALRRPSVRHEHYHRPLLTRHVDPACKAPTGRLLYFRLFVLNSRHAARPLPPAAPDRLADP